MRAVIAGLALTLAACGGGGVTSVVTPPAKPKPDPYLTIRVRDLMDTTTRPGRADWRTYILLTGPFIGKNALVREGAIGLPDIRAGHNMNCVGVGADSVGQRLIAILAVADTTTSALTSDAPFDSLAARWYAGNLTLPSGWMVLTFAATDAWQSAQYIAGHGLTMADPIKWGFDWTARGTTAFYERTDTDPVCSTM